MDNQGAVFDHEGFLVDFRTWNEALAFTIAQAEAIALTQEHWEIIHSLRNFYQEYEWSPAMRPFVKYIKQHLGPDKGNSIYLMRLFPQSPAKLAAKIAGLPKPENCL